MGSVYLAHDLALDRQVAIKFISTDKAADPSARRRLIREARAAAALDHPNICSVFEVIDTPDHACIVMQYVQGESLAEMLRRGPLDVRFAMRVATDLAAALAAAHRGNVIHRDVKPQNVAITPDRHAKLLDFGIARQVGPTKEAPDATTITVTVAGQVVGTPAYMSPEQIQGGELDGRSDLFALGAVLFECLTGQRAFKGSTAIELANQVLSYHPPPVSSLRPELTDRHDELIRRLLAKDAHDRFSSADEVLGALRLLSSNTSRTENTGRSENVDPPTGRSRVLILAAALAIVALAALGIWRMDREIAMPVNSEAADWYRLGTQAIRDGAPHSAKLALSEAIRAAPDYPPAYIRLAEAETEIDDANGAEQALLQVNQLVPNESRLPFEHRTRVRAVRALMLRDVDGAVRAYTELSNRYPRDAGAWLDLGRAQDASGRRGEARASYEKALQISDQFAPAHLLRGTVLGMEGRYDEALAAFAEAERLYRAAARVEGEVETLIRRGNFYNGLVEPRKARADLERAMDLAGTLQTGAQQIRATLTLSTVMVTEGKWEEAEKTAAAAVESALSADLETVAADGLVDLALALIVRGKGAEAEAQLNRAIALADKRRVQRIVMRANLQRAALLVQEDRPAEGLAAARRPLEYFQAARYRRYELLALSIMSRAHEMLGEYAQARTIAEQAMRTATEIGDESQIAESLENLAGSANAQGALSDALDYRARGLDIHRRQNDLSALGYDLVNRADLLIRAGEHAEAGRLLDEIDQGAASKSDAYLPRARRARVLRALSAAIQHQPDQVRRYARDFPADDKRIPDSNSRLAALLLHYADAIGNARGGGSPSTAALAGDVVSPTGRELRYWDLAGRLARGAAADVLAGAEETLRDTAVSYEFDWRVAALGAAAARQLKDAERARALGERANRGLDRIRKEWKTHVASYEARPDLAELRRRAGLE